MSDLWHKLLNFADHYRWTFAGLALVALVIAGLAGCQPKAINPLTSEPATEREIRADVAAYQVEAQQKLETLSRAYEAAIAAAERDYKQQTGELTATAEGVNLRTEAALEQIAEQKAAGQALIQALAGTLQQQAGPGFGALIGAGVGLAGLVFGTTATLDSRRKDRVIADKDKPQA